MPQPLLSESQLAALRGVAELGMINTVVISRPTQVDSAYGDDANITYVTVGTAKGWFRSTPTPVASADVGSLVTINTYRLLLPTGTDIRPKDQVHLGSEIFLVTDTTGESTYQPYLQVSLRRRE